MRKRTSIILAVALFAGGGALHLKANADDRARAERAAAERLEWAPAPERIDPVTGKPQDAAAGDVVVPRRHIFIGPDVPWIDKGGEAGR